MTGVRRYNHTVIHSVIGSPHMANTSKPSFYITTPIYYPSAAPHLGTS